MRRTRLSGFFLAGLLLAGLVPTARAGYVTTYTQTFSIPLTETDWGPTTETLVGKDPFAIQAFDGSKHQVFGHDGTLYAVGVKLDYTFENTITMQFTRASTLSVVAQGSMHLAGPNGKDLVNSPTFVNSSTLTGANQSITLPMKVVSSSSGLGYKDAATLASFTGTGTILLPIYASATSNFSSSTGTGGGSSVTLAMANLSLTYFIAPEPSSFVLGGLGLASLGLYAWCRRSR